MRHSHHLPLALRSPTGGLGALLCIVLVLAPVPGRATDTPPGDFASAATGAPLADTVTVAQANRCDLEERERAVLLARGGAYDQALPVLESLHRAAPLDLPCRGDLAAVLNWAGRHGDAMAVGGRLPFGELDPIVAEAVAHSARSEGYPVFAADLYRGVASSHPDRIEAQIGLMLSLLEGGGVAAAEARRSLLLERFPEHPEALVASAHVLRRQERYVEAARLLQRARSHAPGHADAQRLEALTLGDAGAVFLAVDRMRAAPSLFDDAERGRLLAARAARAVQWAPAAVADPADRFVATDRALAQIDSALAEIGPEAGIWHRQLRFDRIVALGQRMRMEELRADVVALEAEGVELPPFVEQLAGDAALYLRRPAEAEARYRRAIEHWPDGVEVRIGLFHALVQSNRYAEAKAVIDELLDRQPEIRYGERWDEGVSNPDRVSAAVTAQLGRAYAGDLATAQRSLEELHARAPLNLSIRQELGSVYLWRGWPDRALEVYDRILLLDPEHVGARVGRASAALALDMRSKARSSADTLRAFAPENEHVRRLADQVRVDGLWALSVSAGGGRSSGGELGTRDQMFTSRLTSPPVADRLRVFVTSRRRSATYEEGRGRYDRVGGGLELRGRRLRLSVEGHRNREGEARPGGGGELALRLGDRWSARVAGSSRSPEVPLQAAQQGLDAWRASAALTYRAHEGRSWLMDAGYLEMSDGNRRESLYAGLDQALVRRPRGGLALRLEGYAARNSRENAPYFNPSQILSPSATLRWEATLWRSYDRSFVQTVALTGGSTHQEGVDAEVVGGARYEHAWSLSPRFALRYGVEWGRPVYDGVRERRTAFSAGVDWRLP